MSVIVRLRCEVRGPSDPLPVEIPQMPHGIPGDLQGYAQCVLDSEWKGPLPLVGDRISYAGGRLKIRSRTWVGDGDVILDVDCHIEIRSESRPLPAGWSMEE